jgi:hypothetical protein
MKRSTGFDGEVLRESRPPRARVFSPKHRTVALLVQGVAIGLLYAYYAYSKETIGVFEVVLVSILGFVLMNIYGLFQPDQIRQ